MESNESKKCLVCHQTKLARYFPKTTRSTGMLAQTPICLSCQAALDQSGSGDEEGGSGGKQLKHVQDAKTLQHSLELEDALQKELIDLAAQQQDKLSLQAARENESKNKNQAAQREWLDQKEEELKVSQEDDEPNPEVSLDTQVKKKNIVHLFSVTRLLALNRITANNKEATTKKNFGLFSKKSEQQRTTKSAQQNDSKNDKQKLTAESSTLFSQINATKPTGENTEKLATAIQEGQKIFK